MSCCVSATAEVPTPLAIVSPKITVIYYSTYGHVKILCDAAVEGLRSGGADVKVFRVPETLPEEVLAKMHAAGLKHNEGVPEVPRDTWHEADGFIFAFPTRFGGMPSQMKAFFDGTGGLWQTGGLQSKFCGFITSTATQNGGQETTILNSLSNCVHHGMIYVPPGYLYGKMQFDNSTAHGGSPWGPSTLANGDGSRLPSDDEKEYARLYGAKLAGVVKAHVTGKAAVAAVASA